MIRIIIGHRGVGKTSLLKRLKSYSSSLIICDLDEVIETETKKNILEIFSESGISIFRKLEKKYFESVFKKYSTSQFRDRDVYIALGAGFCFDLPKECHVLWLRRPTDDCGRVFLEKPRLLGELSPLHEYRHLLKRRNDTYNKQSHHSLFLQEGLGFGEKFEKFFFTENSLLCESNWQLGFLTVCPSLFRDKDFLENWLKKRIEWNICKLELRDDLLDREQILYLKKRIPSSNLLISLRGGSLFGKHLKPFLSLSKSKRVLFDWSLDLGAPEFETQIISLHKRESKECVEDLCEKLNEHKGAAHLKLAIPISSWKDLEKGHDWWLEDKEKRSFLPMSEDGRWSWYRLFHKNKMAINFFREEEQALKDQPLLFDWMVAPKSSSYFAAILGHPVKHSLTPSFHHDFFLNRKMPVLRVDIQKKDFSDAFSFLERIGMRAAAVTSPLKQEARKLVKDADFLSLNTLCFKDRCWVGTNTDGEGLRSLLKQSLSKRKVVVWGGGGTLELLKNILPQGHFYSAREGVPRAGSFSCENPELLIWAAGNQGCGLPPSWRPKHFIDLSYREDSLAKEKALEYGAKYTSGMEMFISQAELQQKFWLKNLF